MSDYNEILGHIEIHSPEGIRDYFRQGGSPKEVHAGVPHSSGVFPGKGIVASGLWNSEGSSSQ